MLSTLIAKSIEKNAQIPVDFGNDPFLRACKVATIKLNLLDSPSKTEKMNTDEMLCEGMILNDEQSLHPNCASSSIYSNVEIEPCAIDESLDVCSATEKATARFINVISSCSSFKYSLCKYTKKAKEDSLVTLDYTEITGFAQGVIYEAFLAAKAYDMAAKIANLHGDPSFVFLDKMKQFFLLLTKFIIRSKNMETVPCNNRYWRDINTPFIHPDDTFSNLEINAHAGFVMFDCIIRMYKENNLEQFVSFIGTSRYYNERFSAIALGQSC